MGYKDTVNTASIVDNDVTIKITSTDGSSIEKIAKDKAIILGQLTAEKESQETQIETVTTNANAEIKSIESLITAINAL